MTDTPVSDEDNEIRMFLKLSRGHKLSIIELRWFADTWNSIPEGCKIKL